MLFAAAKPWGGAMRAVDGQQRGTYGEAAYWGIEGGAMSIMLRVLDQCGRDRPVGLFNPRQSGKACTAEEG